MKSSFIIGITGGSGSGKTSLLNTLRDSFSPKHVAVLSQDNYYKPIDEQYVDNEGIENFDLPDALMLDEYIRDLQKLRAGGNVQREEYTFNNDGVKPADIYVNSAPVIVAEGLFMLHIEEIRQLLDLSIYVQVDDVIKLKRRIERDKVERNYPMEDVLYRYEHHVLPAYRRYIQPYRSHADIIINNNVDMEGAVAVIVGYVKTLLDSR